MSRKIFLEQSEIELRKKRLLYRSQHRGIKEIDIFLGEFAKQNLLIMSEDELDIFETLLEEKDLDLYNWITCKEPIPNHLNHDLIYAILQFNKKSTTSLQ